MAQKSLVPVNQIASKIIIVCDQRVIFDTELAVLYGVTTSRLNEQVKRNKNRFPKDFMFQLTAEEYRNLRSQFAIANSSMRRGKVSVFTECGAIMAANVLNSPQAIDMSVLVVRAFVSLRQAAIIHEDLEKRITSIESQVLQLVDQGHEHSIQIGAIIETLNELIQPISKKPGRPIGVR